MPLVALIIAFGSIPISGANVPNIDVPLANFNLVDNSLLVIFTISVTPSFSKTNIPKLFKILFFLNNHFWSIYCLKCFSKYKSFLEDLSADNSLIGISPFIAASMRPAKVSNSPLFRSLMRLINSNNSFSNSFSSLA